jgi:hypothetical protein
LFIVKLINLPEHTEFNLDLLLLLLIQNPMLQHHMMLFLKNLHQSELQNLHESELQNLHQSELQNLHQLNLQNLIFDQAEDQLELVEFMLNQEFNLLDLVELLKSLDLTKLFVVLEFKLHL